MEEDSTLGFTSHAGFRTGTCYSYKVFDILQRKELTLTETPLLLMEVALLKEVHYNFEVFFKKAIELKNNVKQFNGTFVFLWHNNSFDFGIFYDKKQFYLQLLKELSK